MTNLVHPLSQYSEILSEQKTHENVISTLGVKSASLGQILNNQIQIPESFCLETKVYQDFKGTDQTDISDELWEQILKQVNEIQEKTHKSLGSDEDPLFLSVRCDSTSEVCGMLCSVINVGFNDLTARALEKKTGNREFAFNMYSRFIRGYAQVVLNISTSVFDNLLNDFMKFRKLKNYSDFTAIEWIEVTKLYKSVIMRRIGLPFPQNPLVQLRKVIAAVLRSCSNENVQKYRSVFHLTNNFGFSVLVQEMVFGTMNSRAFSAVVSSRNPVDGGPDISGTFCNNALPCDIKYSMCNSKPFAALSGEQNQQIIEITKKIEQAFASPQTVDFVYDGFKLYVVGARPVVFSGAAKFSAVRDMTNAGLITKENALMCLTPDDLNALTASVFEKEPNTALVNGTPAGAGVVVGKLVTDPKDLLKKTKSAHVYIKEHITPQDFNDILRAGAVVSKDEGTSSYAARILRLLRKPAILDSKFEFDNDTGGIQFEFKCSKPGETVSVGATGNLFPKAQKVGTRKEAPNSPASTVLQWADGIRSGKIFVYSPAQTADDLKLAQENGADGASCFNFDNLIKDKRIDVIKTYAEKRSEKAFPQLQNVFTNDLKTIFQGGNTTVLLMENPLSSYYPNPCPLAEEVASLTATKEYKENNDQAFKKEKDLTAKSAQLEAIKKMHEDNPLLGVHGVRMNILHEPLLKLQFNSIIEAAKAENIKEVKVLLPSVTFPGEVAQVKAITEPLIGDSGVTILYGASIDTPRACLIADDIAKECDFVAFSTSLLQTTSFAMSQVDADKTFLKTYLEDGVLSSSPFVTFDDDGVGDVLREGAKLVKSAKPEMSIMVYGNQCGDAHSIKFCSSIGVKSISCPVAMIPVAKLCCAQAVISE